MNTSSASKVHGFDEWKFDFPSETLLKEEVDCNMIYAFSNTSMERILGNFSLESGFGWVFTKPIKFQARWRKFKKYSGRGGLCNPKVPSTPKQGTIW